MQTNYDSFFFLSPPSALLLWLSRTMMTMDGWLDGGATLSYAPLYMSDINDLRQQQRLRRPSRRSAYFGLDAGGEEDDDEDIMGDNIIIICSNPGLIEPGRSRRRRRSIANPPRWLAVSSSSSSSRSFDRRVAGMLPDPQTLST